MNRKDLRRGSARNGGGLKRPSNGPPEGELWRWQSLEMLESVAYRSLNLAARNVLVRINVEHLAHGGFENGNLIVPYADFIAYGIRGPSIAPAIRQLEAFGLIRVNRGRVFKGEHEPNIYTLTHLPTKDGALATNRWKAVTQKDIAAWKSRIKLENARKRDVKNTKRVAAVHSIKVA